VKSRKEENRRTRSEERKSDNPWIKIKTDSFAYYFLILLNDEKKRQKETKLLREKEKGIS
jgi:hypothetical protein